MHKDHVHAAVSAIQAYPPIPLKLSPAATRPLALDRSGVSAARPAVSDRPERRERSPGHHVARIVGWSGGADRAAPAATPMEAVDLAIAAAAAGVGPCGRDPDLLVERLFLAGITHERCASFGALGDVA